jgi:catechol 2,3-dioxygenase-like lactoylglutathione lyase family enzyme
MKFNSLIPELSVTDLDKSLDFYTKRLGFKVEYQRPEDRFAFLSLEKNQLMIEQSNKNWQTERLEHPFGRGLNLQMEVSRVSPLIDSLKKSSITLFDGPKENWYRKENKLLGSKEFLVQDPDGYLLRFAEDLGKKDLRTL